jgi:hypothetical protein
VPGPIRCTKAGGVCHDNVLVLRHAALTIVAATEPSAWVGLPGVRPTPRAFTRKVNEVAPGVRMTIIVDVDAVLRTSHYSTRAWT